eukprot:gene24349-17456_t
MPGPPSPSTEVLDWLLELGLESYSSWFLRTSSTNTMDGLVVLAKSGSKAIDTFIDAANVGSPNGLLSTPGNKVSVLEVKKKNGQDM